MCRISNVVETESRLVIDRSSGRDCLIIYRISFWVMKNVLELGGGHGFYAAIPIITELYTSKWRK